MSASPAAGAAAGRRRATRARRLAAAGRRGYARPAACGSGAAAEAARLPLRLRQTARRMRSVSANSLWRLELRPYMGVSLTMRLVALEEAAWCLGDAGLEQRRLLGVAPGPGVVLSPCDPGPADGGAPCRGFVRKRLRALALRRA